MKSFKSIIGSLIFSHMKNMGFVFFDSDTALEPVFKRLDTIEANLKAESDKASLEVKALGKVSSDTQTALDNIGIKQRELADDLLQIKQRQDAPKDKEVIDSSWGAQFVKSAGYEAFASGNQQKARFEVKNTLVGSDTNVAPARAAGVVGGAFLPMGLEAFLPSVSTTSNAVEFTRELAFTNGAAESAEGALKAEASLTWDLINQPVSKVDHFIRISKQLASDAPALAAYVNTRMSYGVNLKVETQLVAGNAVGANISGILKAGNFTAHGIANAALGATLKKLVLIRKVLADSWAAGYPADGIVLNPADWATLEIDLMTTAAGQTLYNVNATGQAFLFGVPVIQSIGMTAGSFSAGAFGQAYMIHNREGVVIELSDSDSDNFVKGLLTIRAERRLALATERPAAVRAGTLTPA